jgi:ADP-heptose:LPS heptosyltransferase
MASVLERQLKRLGLFGLARLARTPRQGRADIDHTAVRRILVVRPDERIGNAILIIPLLNALRGCYPQARLSLVMARRYWDLRELIPSVDEFIPFDKRRYARNPIAFAAFIRRLRKCRYDLVFDAAGDHSVSFTHLAIAACSGGRFRIGHDRGGAGQCYEVPVPVAPDDRHETERHLDLLRAIAAVDPDPRPLLKPLGDHSAAERIWRDQGWRSDKPTVIIHPGARGRKRWPASHFAVSANRLAAQGCQVGVVWGPADTQAAEEMMRAVDSGVRPLGVLSFPDFVAAVASATVFFSGDCGPMHLAAATPPRQGVVAVFVVDKLARYRPLGPRDIAVIDDPDHPDIAGIVAHMLALANVGDRSEIRRSAIA